VFFRKKPPPPRVSPGTRTPAGPARGRRPGQAALYERALARLQSSSGPIRVLDIGCGSGILSLRLAEAVPNISVIGIDSSSDLVRFATHAAMESNACRRLSFQRAELASLPIPDATVDLVLGAGVLRESASPQTLLVDIHRVLVPGGSALLLEAVDTEAEQVVDAPARHGPMPLARLQRLLAGSPFRNQSAFELPEEPDPDAFLEVLLTKPLPEPRYGRR
jgi:SAM-dependent methyltransferase